MTTTIEREAESELKSEEEIKTKAEPKTKTETSLQTKRAGKYLTFCLRQEYFGIPVHKIREIIQMLEVTSVPQMPEYVRGVVNLRGKIIPVIDLRLRFEMGRTETDGRTCIVVVQVNLADNQPTQMGMVVDAVEEVVNISGSDIEETPTFGAKLRSDYILGMAKVKGKLKALLDIDRIIQAETLTTLVLPV